MKINVDKYQVNKSLNCNESMKFISFSDIHYGVIQQLFYKGYMKVFFRYIIDNSKGANAILIPGDLIFWLSKYQDKDFLKALSRDLKDFSFVMGAPVCISYGNHDLPFKISEMTEEEKQFWNLGHYIDDRSNGVYVLNNEQVRFNNLVVTGFSPSRDAYAPNAMPEKALEMAYESFVKSDFSFSDEDINILLSHDNKFFAYQENASRYNNLYEKLFLILGGHLHDGYIPLWLQNLLKDSLKDYGIWENIPAKIDMCRGAFKVSNCNTSEVILPNDREKSIIDLQDEEALSIVNRGVAKYSWFIPSTPSYTEIEVNSVLKKVI